eukprot:gene5196-10389_t
MVNSETNLAKSYFKSTESFPHVPESSPESRIKSRNESKDILPFDAASVTWKSRERKSSTNSSAVDPWGQPRRNKIKPVDPWTVPKCSFVPRESARLTPHTYAFGHESFDIIVPSEKDMEDYRLGNRPQTPLKVIMHNQRGMKLSRCPNENTSHSKSRNIFGGFYSQR